MAHSLAFLSLGSGSKGNATLVRGGDTLLLVDCGFSLREVEARMARVGLSIGDLHAVLVSHEHGDHVRGLGPLLRKYPLPVYMTHGTHRALRDARFDRVDEISPHSAPFSLGDLMVEPCPIPHDAAEPCQFSFAVGGRRFGLFTDVGHVTPHIRARAANCDALLLEANHDPDMLRHGPYPWSLQERIRGGYGHLSNPASAALLASLAPARLQWVAFGHLSEQNNTPSCVLDAAGEASDRCAARASVLAQHEPGEWLAIT